MACHRVSQNCSDPTLGHTEDVSRRNTWDAIPCPVQTRAKHIDKQKNKEIKQNTTSHTTIHNYLLLDWEVASTTLGREQSMIIINAVRLSVLLHEIVRRQWDVTLGTVEALWVPVLAHGSKHLKKTKGVEMSKKKIEHRNHDLPCP